MIGNCLMLVIQSTNIKNKGSKGQFTTASSYSKGSILMLAVIFGHKSRAKIWCIREEKLT